MWEGLNVFACLALVICIVLVRSECTNNSNVLGIEGVKEYILLHNIDITCCKTIILWLIKITKANGLKKKKSLKKHCRLLKCISNFAAAINLEANNKQKYIFPSNKHIFLAMLLTHTNVYIKRIWKYQWSVQLWKYKTWITLNKLFCLALLFQKAAAACNHREHHKSPPLASMYIFIYIHLYAFGYTQLPASFIDRFRCFVTAYIGLTRRRPLL